MFNPTIIVGLVSLIASSQALSIQLRPPVNVIAATFDNNSTEGFEYKDDTFRRTKQPDYALGDYLNKTGVLSIKIGGVDDETVRRMSGGWKITFTLPQDALNSKIDFKYQIRMPKAFERNEAVRIMARLDRQYLRFGNTKNITLAIMRGTNGKNKKDQTSDWRVYEAKIGKLKAGKHKIVIGAFLNQKNEAAERATILFDDINFASQFFPKVPPIARPPPIQIDCSDLIGKNVTSLRGIHTNCGDKLIKAP